MSLGPHHHRPDSLGRIATVAIAALLLTVFAVFLMPLLTHWGVWPFSLVTSRRF